jgi:hypothetical protein
VNVAQNDEEKEGFPFYSVDKNRDLLFVLNFIRITWVMTGGIVPLFAYGKGVRTRNGIKNGRIVLLFSSLFNMQPDATFVKVDAYRFDLACV